MNDIVKGMTSIVIPTFNGRMMLEACIKAIRMHTTEPYEIIVVDNGSIDGTAEFCIEAGVTLVALGRNVGFPAACNRGLTIASGEQLLLLNNDVIVTSRWLTNLLTALYSANDVGMVGPVTNYASGRQKIEVAWDSVEQFVEIASRHNVSDPGKWQEVQRLVGLCLMFRREVWEKVGFFDERFSPGHYEDDDYCFRARQEGYRLLIGGDTLVFHAGSQSFSQLSPDRLSDILTRNRKLFMDKWHVDPWIFM